MWYWLSRWTGLVSLVALAAVGSGAPGPASGQVGRAAPRPEDPPPTLNLRVRFANASGQLPAMTGVSGQALDGGDALLMLGTAGDGELCGSQGQFAVTGSPELPANAAGSHVWHVSARVLRVDLDRVTFAVDLVRYQRRAGWYEAVLKEMRTLTLREEQWTPVDAVTVLPERRGACGVAAAVLEASADFVESAADRSGAVDYELWLVHRHGTPIEPQRRLGTRRPGEVWEFSFGTIDEPVGECVAQTTVSGTVRARMLEDGQVEVLMAPARWIGQKLGPERAVGSPDEDAGRKVARVPRGIAVEFRLPPPSPAVIEWDKWEPCGERRAGQSLFARQLTSQSLALILKVSAAPGSDLSAR
jgi:hypothetical protein